LPVRAATLATIIEFFGQSFSAGDIAKKINALHADAL